MDSNVQYNLAVTLLRNGKTDEAIAGFEKYLHRNSNDVKTWLLLADLYEKKGNHAQAKATYEMVVQKNPQNKEALVCLIPVLEKLNDKGGEIANYEKLLQIEPHNRKYLFNAAMLYMDQKKYDKAQAHLQAIASMDPKDVESRNQLLIVYQKLRNDKGELQVRQELTKLDPKTPQIWTRYTNITKTGRTTKACRLTSAGWRNRTRIPAPCTNIFFRRRPNWATRSQPCANSNT